MRHPIPDLGKNGVPYCIFSLPVFFVICFYKALSLNKDYHYHCHHYRYLQDNFQVLTKHGGYCVRLNPFRVMLEKQSHSLRSFKHKFEN